jgi:hypothetical protein
VARLKIRVDRLETAVVETFGAAVDRLLPLLSREERRALSEVIDAAVGQGPEVDIETSALADQAAARMLAAATDAERRLLSAVLPRR